MNKDSIFIDKIKKNYKTSFPENWIDNGYDWHDVESSKRSYSQCKRKIKDFSELFFVNFSKSLLSGEYIENNKLIHSIIDYLIGHNEIEYTSSDESENLFKLKITDDFKSLMNNIKISSLRYKAFITFYMDRVDPIDHNYKFRIYEDVNKRDPSNIISDFEGIVIPICRYDMSFSCSGQDTDRMLLISHILKSKIESCNVSGEVKFIYEICNEKNNFLMKKMLSFLGPVEYSFDFKNITISEKNLKIESTEEYISRFKIFNNNNPIEIPEIKKYQHSIYDDIDSHFSEMVLIMRFYCKNKNSSLKQIDNLLDEFNRKYNQLYGKTIKGKFDKYALNSIHNVMYNCRLSYLLTRDDYDLEKLENDIDEFTFFQNQTGAFNYYPYKVVIEYLIKKANETSENVDGCKNILLRIRNMLLKYILIYEKCIKSCRETGFYPLQLMYNECCIKFRNFTLFISSTFSQPVDYDELNEKKVNYKVRLQMLDSKIEVIDDKLKINAIESDVNHTTSKFIEIGGAFVAILSLLFGIISFSTECSFDFKQMLIHSFGLGLILLVFSSSIYVLTLDRKAKIVDNLKSIRFCFFILVMLFSFIVLFQIL